MLKKIILFLFTTAIIAAAIFLVGCNPQKGFGVSSKNNKTNENIQAGLINQERKLPH